MIRYVNCDKEHFDSYYPQSQAETSNQQIIIIKGT